MTYKMLKAKGHKFWEHDSYDGFIYLSTTEYWECDGDFYMHYEHSNANRYTGETCTKCYGDIKQAYDSDFFATYMGREEIKDAYDRMVAELEAKDTPASSLKDARLVVGMTQAQLAEASGVNLRQIQRIESGESLAKNVTAGNLIAIADALGIDPHDLI